MIQEATDTNTSSIRLEELAHTSIELARLVATNLAAPPELLTELASSSDEITRQNVTANPNTPTEVLFKLGEEFPEQLLNNTIFSLLFRENPNLLHKISGKTLMILLKHESAPLSFLQLANGRFSDYIQQAVRLHINWAWEIYTNVNEVVWTEIHNTHLNYGSTDENLSFLWIEAESYATKISIPEFIIQQLLKHSCREIKCIVAQHPNTSAHILEWLLQYDDSNDYEYWRRIAKNPNTPVHLLEKWARNQNGGAYWGVAENPNTPAHILEMLAVQVAYKNANNPNIPVTLIEKWVQNEEGILLSCIDEISNTPVHRLGLIGLEALIFLSLIWANPNTPAHILELLAQDENINVRSSVAKNPNIPAHLLELLAQDENINVRYAVAANPNTPAHILELWAQDENSSVRGNVAANPNTPIHILELLAQDKDSYVRGNVAANPNTPAHILELLTQDDDDSVFDNLADNPNIPLHYLLKFNRGFISESWHSLIRFLVLSSPDTPSEALATNSNSLDWVERFAITQNPNVTPDVLQTLAKDGNRIVRAAAKANLERGNGKSDILHHNQ